MVKNQFYKKLLVFLNKECNQSVKEIVELNFNFERESDKIQESNYFFDNNILVKRKIKGKEDEVRGKNKMIVVSFHSRRVQYAFSIWVLQFYPEYWKKIGTPGREEFRELLEKIEYNYILSFEVYSLKQTIKKTDPDFKDVEEEKAAKI